MKPERLSEETRAALRHVVVGPGEVDMRRFPDFMIIGPQRTGTTWLFRNLEQHPKVRLPLKKETYYFSTLGNPEHHRHQFATLQDYLKIFYETPKRLIKRNYDSLRRAFTRYRPDVTGEATATYATLKEGIIEDIVLLNPDIKIILMLRDPIDRAWSHAKKDLRKKGRRIEDASRDELDAYFASKGQRMLADFPGMIQRWGKHLKPGHLFVATFDDLGKDSPALLKSTCRFLGVPDTKRYFYRKHLGSKINPTTGAVSEDIQKHLEQHFAEEKKSYLALLEEIKRNKDGDRTTACGIELHC